MEESRAHNWNRVTQVQGIGTKLKTRGPFLRLIWNTDDRLSLVHGKGFQVRETNTFMKKQFKSLKINLKKYPKWGWV